MNPWEVSRLTIMCSQNTTRDTIHTLKWLPSRSEERCHLHTKHRPPIWLEVKIEWQARNLSNFTDSYTAKSWRFHNGQQRPARIIWSSAWNDIENKFLRVQSSFDDLMGILQNLNTHYAFLASLKELTNMKPTKLIARTIFRDNSTMSDYIVVCMMLFNVFRARTALHADQLI